MSRLEFEIIIKTIQNNSMINSITNYNYKQWIYKYYANGTKGAALK